MDEIKKLLNVQVSTYRYYNNSKLIYLLRFIKILIFNVGIIKFLKYLLNKDKNKFENYSKTWKQQIKDDIKLNQNWRRDRKYFLDIFNINSISMSYTPISRIFFYKLIKKYFNNIIFTNNLHNLSTFLIAKRNSIKYEKGI